MAKCVQMKACYTRSLSDLCKPESHFIDSILASTYEFELRP